MWSIPYRPHAVNVYRLSTTVSALTETLNGYLKVFTALPCLIEPRSGQSGMRTPIGDMAEGQFLMTWDSQSLTEGDRVMYNGLSYTLHPNQDDRSRPSSDTTIEPMQVGKLELNNLPALP